MKEVTFSFGPDSALIGTLTTVAGVPAGTTALLLFNAGLIPRIGPNRLNVRIARSLAAHGVPTLRFDLSGRGDSAPARTATSFEEQAVLDLRTAMDAVSQRTGAERFLLMGICSGAECAYHASLADERVIGICLMDSYHFPTWRTHLNRYRHRARQHGGWIKAITARIRRQVASGVHPQPAESTVSAASFGSIRPDAPEFASKLAQLVTRGVDVDLLYSGSFLETYNYAKQFRDVFGKYGIVERIRVDFDPELDHTLSIASMQQKVVARVQQWALNVVARPRADSLREQIA